MLRSVSLKYKIDGKSVSFVRYLPSESIGRIKNLMDRLAEAIDTEDENNDIREE